jgi:hypothetical protein
MPAIFPDVSYLDPEIECETLAISRGHIFGELQQLSHVPVNLFRWFATEIGLAGK